MDGKICLVTGANSGIGKETARGLARLGARLVMVSRSRKRGEAAAAEIRRDARGPVDLLVADLSSQRSVRDLAAAVAGRYPRLDVLVSNAGVFRLRRALTGDGLEETFAVNHLAPFMLTQLLLDALRRSAPARIVVVASGAHHGASLDFDDLQGERGYRAWRAYSRSKLANIMFTYALARRLDGTRVTANCLHPGFVATRLGSGNRIPVRPFMLLMRPFALSPKQGAETPVYLATSPEVEGVSGRYFDKKRPVRSSRVSYDEDAQERLWHVSEELTRLA